MKIKAGWLLIFFFIVQYAFGQNGAYEFVSNLYSHYQNDTAGFSSINPKSIDTIFSPEFFDLMRLNEKQNQEGLGYDPVCDCQDDNGFKMGKIEIFTQKSTTFAEVKFKISDTDFDIKLKLVKKNKKWFIDDVVTTRGSLHDLLKKNASTHK
jgi:hypothetical protein